MKNKYILLFFIVLAGFVIGAFILHKEYKRYLPKKYVEIIENYEIEFFKTSNKVIDEEPSLYKYFDKIYVITLENRLKYVMKIFDDLNTSPNYIKALHKDSLKEVYINLYGAHKSIQHFFGEVGCYYSHRQALQHCIASKSKFCAIFEDDLLSILPKEILFEKIEQSLRELPSDWEILYLGRCRDKDEDDVGISEMLLKPSWPLCTHAYVVNERGASILLDNSKYMKKNIDGLYGKMVNRGKIKAYALRSSLFTQNRSCLPSQIGDTKNI